MNTAGRDGDCAMAEAIAFVSLTRLSTIACLRPAVQRAAETGSPARLMTASAFAIASPRAAGADASPTSGPSRPRALFSLRTHAVTWCPAPRSRAVSSEPINPVAPVMNTRIAPYPGSESAHAQVLDFEILLDPVLRTFSPDTRLLHPPERRDLGRDDSLIDSHHPVLQSLGDTPDSPDVPAVEIASQAVLGVVAHHDCIALGPETR